MNILALLGIDSTIFNVENIIDENEREIVIHVETKRNVSSSCPFCKNKTTVSKGIKYQLARHQISNITTKTIIISIKKRKLYCKNCNKSFVQKIDFINFKCQISNDIKWLIFKDLKEPVSFSYIGRKYKITPQYVKEIFLSFPTEGRAALPMCMSIDEKSFKSEFGKYICVISNSIKSSIVDIIPSRTKDYLYDYFSKINKIERETVRFYSSDMFEGYRTIKRKFFPNALHIIDPFHVTKLFTEAIQRARKNYMSKYSKETKEYKFIKDNWKLFLINPSSKRAEKLVFVDRLTGVVYTLRQQIILIIKRDPELYFLYNLFCDFCEYIDREYSDNELEISLSFIINKALSSTSKIAIELGQTLYKFYEEILNYYKSLNIFNVSNAAAESINNKIECMFRVSRGYRDFYTLKKRLLYSFKKVE